MNRTLIDWPTKQTLFTWSPVVGCMRGCKYCYAAKMYRRLYKGKFSDITLYENRLAEPEKDKNPRAIFVGSMSDICFWSDGEVAKVIKACENAPWHTYMFLTKAPEVYKRIDFKKTKIKSFRLGMTLTSLPARWNLEHAMHLLGDKGLRPFVSLEPLLGLVEQPLNYEIENVICGAMTGQHAIPPQKEWIESVKKNVPKKKLFWKKNIREML